MARAEGLCKDRLVRTTAVIIALRAMNGTFTRSPSVPVYHFIFHAYGTWHPDHADGWHQHGVAGTRRSDAGTAKYRREVQRFETIAFSPEVQPILVDMVREVCGRRGWRCHSVAANETHVHAVISWSSGIGALEAHDTLKRLLGWSLAKHSGVRGRKWMSHGGRPKRIWDLAHLHYLLREYLPEQGGVCWKENDGRTDLETRGD